MSHFIRDATVKRGEGKRPRADSRFAEAEADCGGSEVNLLCSSGVSPL